LESSKNSISIVLGEIQEGDIKLFLYGQVTQGKWKERGF